MFSKRRPSALAFASGLMLTSVLVVNAQAHEMAQAGTELFKPGARFVGSRDAAADIAERPPLYEGLGDLAMEVSTRSKEAQAYFDQGLRLTWAFNHAEARRSFREGQRLDPDCAMCFWGEAFVLGPNINDAMHDDALEPAYAAISGASALKANVTPKERALIEALARRYAPDAGVDRAALDRAWPDAMRDVAEDHPEDTDVLVVFADALMNLQPWDYWEADGLTPKGDAAEILTTLERALEIDPEHVAAAHLYIHAVEASGDPGRAEIAADRLRGAVPAAGHLVHMPAHIYARIGRHRDSMEVNRDAIAADEAFLEQVGEAASPLYRFGYYPHNVHYLMVSAQMAGVREDVIGSAEKLAAVTSDEVSQELAWVQAIKTAPYSAHAQVSDADVVLALADPGDRFPFVKGFWRYARGVAFARSGDLEAARLEVAAIELLIDKADMSDLEAQHLPATDVLGIAQRVVEARIEQAAGDFAAAEHRLRDAVQLQDSLPYMEPPYWDYPVRQTLAAVLLQQGRAEEAIDMFTHALDAAPRSGWVLWGLMQAQIAAGDEAAAAATRTEFAKAWHGDKSLLQLERL